MAKTFKDKRKREMGLFAGRAFNKRDGEDRQQQRCANHERKQILRRAALEELLSGG